MEDVGLWPSPPGERPHQDLVWESSPLGTVDSWPEPNCSCQGGWHLAYARQLWPAGREGVLAGGRAPVPESGTACPLGPQLPYACISPRGSGTADGARGGWHRVEVAIVLEGEAGVTTERSQEPRAGAGL
jgi:hypothetical protein